MPASMRRAERLEPCLRAHRQSDRNARHALMRVPTKLRRRAGLQAKRRLLSARKVFGVARRRRFLCAERRGFPAARPRREWVSLRCWALCRLFSRAFCWACQRPVKFECDVLSLRQGDGKSKVVGTESKRWEQRRKTTFFVSGGTRRTKTETRPDTTTFHSCATVNGMRKPQETKVKNPTFRTRREGWGTRKIGSE